METDAASPGTTVARNLAAIRKRRGLSVRALSQRMAELGQPLLASGITKIEAGQRRVDVDDLVALAVALNVSPNRLVLPDSYGEDRFAATPETVVTSGLAWSWAEGNSPLSEDEEGVDEREQDYQQERPVQLRAVDMQPVVRATKGLLLSARRLAREVARPSEDVTKRLANARQNLARVQAEVDALEEQVDEARRG